MISIIITGAGGQLGKAFAQKLTFQDGFNVFTFDRRQLDIADIESVQGALHTLPKTQFWINCGAYTKVDEAEKNAEAAFLYNSTAQGYIADACKAANVHLIDFSSDYVYHNELRRPLKETDPVEPKGIYAQSKLAGEKAIESSGVDYTILRTSWVYGPDGHNFVNTMLRLGKSNPTLRIVGDQLGAPTFTHDIVDAVKTLMVLKQNDQSVSINGIFNFANSGQVTWDEFARTIFHLQGLEATVETITSAAYGALAPRPEYSVLNCEKITTLLGYAIPHWADGLRRYLAMIS